MNNEIFFDANYISYQDSYITFELTKMIAVSNQMNSNVKSI